MVASIRQGSVKLCNAEGTGKVVQLPSLNQRTSVLDPTVPRPASAPGPDIGSPLFIRQPRPSTDNRIRESMPLRRLSSADSSLSGGQAKRHHLEDELAALHRKGSSIRGIPMSLRPSSPAASEIAEAIAFDDGSSPPVATVDRLPELPADTEESIGDIDDGDADRRLLTEYCELVEQMMEQIHTRSVRAEETFILQPSGLEAGRSSASSSSQLRVPVLPNWMPCCPMVLTHTGQSLPLLSMQVLVDVELNNAQITMRAKWTNANSAGHFDCILLVPTLENSIINECTIKNGTRHCAVAVLPHKALPQFALQERHPHGSLLDDMQWSPGIFRLEIPRVGPQSAVEVTLRYTQSLPLVNNFFQLHVPLTFTRSMLLSPQGVQGAVSVQVRLSCPVSRVAWDCSHLLVHQLEDETSSAITVLSTTPTGSWFTDGFLFCYSLQVKDIEPLVYVSPVPDSDNEGRQLNRLALYIQPNSIMEKVALPRSIVFLAVIRAASSDGALLHIKDTLCAALETLTDADQFNFICCLSGQLIQMAPEMQPATTTTIASAKAWVADTLSISYGGPISHSAFEASTEKVFQLLSGSQADTLRQCFLLVGCYIPDDLGRRILLNVQENNDGVRFMTIGVGPITNVAFLQTMADISQGYHREFPEMATLKENVASFMLSVQRCVLTGINVFLEDIVDVEITPDPLPDLYQGIPVHVTGTFCGDIPPTVLVAGTLRSGASFCKLVEVRLRPTHEGDWMFDRGLVAQYATAAWLQEDASIHRDLVCTSVIHGSPIAPDTTMVMATGLFVPVADIASQQEALSPEEFCRWFTVSSETLRVIGSTVATFGSIAGTEAGQLQVAMRAAEDALNKGLAALLYAERDKRIELVWAEVAERQRSLRGIRLLARRHDAQCRALFEAEAADRSQLLRQVEGGYKNILKVTHYERKAFAARVASLEEPIGQAGSPALMSPTTLPTPSPATMPRTPPSTVPYIVEEEPDKPPSRESAATLSAASVVVVEASEQVARAKLLQKWDLATAALETHYLNERRSVAQQLELRKLAIQFPLLASKWRASRPRAEPGEVGFWRCMGDDIIWLITELQQHPLDARLAAEVCGVMALWAADPELQPSIPHLIVVAEVVRAMRRHPDCQPVQVYGCHALTALVSSANLQLVEREGGLVIVIHALRTALNPAPSLDCIAALATAGSAVRRQLARKGTIPLVMRAMEMHPHDPITLAAAMNAMAALGTATEAATDAQTAIATQGGVDYIFQAMRQFPSNCALLTAAVQALDNLSSFNNFNKAILLSGGAPALILSSMMSFPMHSKLLSHAIGVLTTLASNVYACEAIVKQGGLPLILECMSAFPNRAKLLSKAQHCLDLLARVERDCAKSSRPLAAIKFVRCIYFRHGGPRASTQASTKLLGFCGIPALTALQHSIEAMFEASPLTLFFESENDGRVLLTESTLPGFLRGTVRRLLCMLEYHAGLTADRPYSAASATESNGCGVDHNVWRPKR